MLKTRAAHRARGTSLVEVLVTLVILAFGLLGVAALQSKIGVAEMESYQRSQALLALTQMVDRLTANGNNAASYVSTNLGSATDGQPGDCSTVAGTVNHDLCEWSNTLKGGGEVTGSGTAAARVGGALGALGCVTQIQAPDPTLGNCRTGIYRVEVAWQGTAPTVAPKVACGTGNYGTNDAFRRVVSATVSVGTTSCY